MVGMDNNEDFIPMSTENITAATPLFLSYYHDPKISLNNLKWYLQYLWVNSSKFTAPDFKMEKSGTYWCM